MSELTIEKKSRADFHWQLLTTVSAAALFVGSYAVASAQSADDADRPTVWIELGGQLERGNSSQQPYTPPYLIPRLDAPYNVISPLSIQRPPRYGIGGEGKISFEPRGTDWVFSAALRYGRANGAKHVHQQTSTRSRHHNDAQGNPFYVAVTRFDDTQTSHSQSDLVLDFMAGKDVGLGMLGNRITSVLNFGVRFAQFGSKTDVRSREFPDPQLTDVPVQGFPGKYLINEHHHSYYGHLQKEDSFHGLGPSLSWNGSSLLAGNADSTELKFDWGANAALLFGRQKVSGAHSTTGKFFTNTYFFAHSHYSRVVPIQRSRSVIVPNVGGFAGLTFRRANATVSFGYRADFFFGAMDGGIDARRSEDMSFYGPFATISIGLGG